MDRTTGSLLRTEQTPFAGSHELVCPLPVGCDLPGGAPSEREWTAGGTKAELRIGAGKILRVGGPPPREWSFAIQPVSIGLSPDGGTLLLRPETPVLSCVMLRADAAPQNIDGDSQAGSRGPAFTLRPPIRRQRLLKHTDPDPRDAREFVKFVYESRTNERLFRDLG